MSATQASTMNFEPSYQSCCMCIVFSWCAIHQNTYQCSISGWSWCVKNRYFDLKTWTHSLDKYCTATCLKASHEHIRLYTCPTIDINACIVLKLLHISVNLKPGYSQRRAQQSSAMQALLSAPSLRLSYIAYILRQIGLRYMKTRTSALPVGGTGTRF